MTRRRSHTSHPDEIFPTAPDEEHDGVSPKGNGVAGIVTTLIAGDTVETSGKNINNFALTLITPLDSNNGEIICHRNVYPQGSPISSRSFGTRGKIWHWLGCMP